MKKERYFILCFSFFRERSWGSGSCNLVTDGCYPNLEKTVKQLIEQFNYKNISIINIIELSKKDYLDWSRKEEED